MAKTEDGWDIVSEDLPTRVTFDTIGDEFIGTFRRKESQDGRTGRYDLFIFTDGSVNGEEGNHEELFSCSGSRIAAGMKKVRPGNTVRIRYIADVPTNSENDMKEYEISVRR